MGGHAAKANYSVESLVEDSREAFFFLIHPKRSVPTLKAEEEKEPTFKVHSFFLSFS